MPEKSRLEDVLNYSVADYFSPDDVAAIKHHFQDPKLVEVLRKAFLPTIYDGSLPLEQGRDDVWLTGFKWEQVPAEEAKALILARQDAIKFILGGITRLKVIAAAKEETPDDKKFRRLKDSTQ